MSDQKIDAKELVNHLKKGKELHDDFARIFRDRYTIAGKLMSEWKNYFRVELPPDLNPQTCKIADEELMGLFQEASFYKAEAEARLAAYKSTSDDKYRTRFARLVAEYKETGARLPAKETLAALAETEIGDIKNALTHAEIELSFWKEILNNLQNCRKIIENCTMNLGIEAKALQHEKYIDKLNSFRD